MFLWQHLLQGIPFSPSPLHVKYLYCGVSFSFRRYYFFSLKWFIWNLICFCGISIAELEKLYHIALNGSEEEKSAAAKILCGASLTYGWNIQVRHLC